MFMFFWKKINFAKIESIFETNGEILDFLFYYTLTITKVFKSMVLVSSRSDSMISLSLYKMSML